MSMNRQSSVLEPVKWRAESDFLFPVGEGARLRRARQAIIAGVILAASVLLAVWALKGQWPRDAAMNEIGVFIPGNDEEGWTHFLAAIEIAAKEKGFPLEVVDGSNDCVVKLPSTAARFHWYPEIGARAIGRRAGELCRSARPPLALVGASNSSMTAALAEELKQCDKGAAPLLLMTTATKEDLIDVLPDKSFRFGFSNSYQARAVADRLKEYYAQRGVSKPMVSVISIGVQDDPFSIDLTRRLQSKLVETFGAAVIPPPSSSDHLINSEHEADGFWMLSTATGGSDLAGDEERRLARKIAEAMNKSPERQWVLILPLDTTPYRRLACSLSSELKHSNSKAKRDLVVLSGDSLGYYDFRDASRHRLLPEENPGPVIFFAHSEPAATSSADDGSGETSLFLEVARCLLDSLSRLEGAPTPVKLAAAMRDYRRPGEKAPIFHERERRSGGGAIVALPRPDKQDFEILLPNAWSRSSVAKQNSK